MAEFYSDQYTKLNAAKKLESNEGMIPRARHLFFRYVAPATGMPAAGDTIKLNKLPKGARVTGGFLTWSTGAATATLAIGITGNTGKYLAATAITTAGTSAIARASTATYGLESTGEEEILGTLATAGLAASQEIKGHLEYVLD